MAKLNKRSEPFLEQPYLIMDLYKHYSFDLWLTLIRSNPEYKKQRAKFFFDNYNFHKKSLEEVNHIFRQVDLMCNAINERTGKNIDAEEMYLMVISLVNDNRIPLDEIDIDEIYIKMETLLFQYLPFLYCDETFGVLNHLKQNNNSSISILSNTGFIKGLTLRKVLKELNLLDLFDFQIYSDETGFSKPSKNLFQLMVKTAVELRGDSLSLNEILHVGDNPIADIAGATKVGIDSLLINNNDARILDLIR